MSRFSEFVRQRRWTISRRVRPWALGGPVIILLICLPLLRPLRHPGQISDDEALRLATIRAIVERHALAIEPEDISANAIAPSSLVAANQKLYSDQPPMLAALLAGPYWIMLHIGRTSFHENPALVPYLLTLIGVTLPVAGAAGLIYRMGRQFELPRIWRAALGLGVVIGSGLLSYAVVLNSYAPAAVLLLSAMGCVVHVAASKKPGRAGGWLILCGTCATTAVAIEPAALLPALLIAICIATIRMRPALRAGGVAMFILGAFPPILVHSALILPIAHELVPSSSTRELWRGEPAAGDQKTSDLDDEETRAAQIGRFAGRVYTALIGSHGLFSHFPVILLGLAGVGAVMHRNWLPSTKSLAAASGIAMGGTIGLFCFSRASWRDAMFAAKWFIVFTPLVLYWSGAWIRRPHSNTKWGIAAALMFFSAIVALIGATSPCPPGGFDRYTVAGALENLAHPSSSTAPALATRR